LTTNNEKLVYVVTRVDNDDDTDHVIGVWNNEYSIVPALKELFEWATKVWIRGAWVMAKDGEDDRGEVSKIAYITRCFAQ